MKPDDKVRCSFCGKSSKQVRKMIAGLNNTYICDECVELCQEIFDEEMGGEASGGEISDLHLLKPREIKEFLDEYSRCYADQTILFDGVNEMLEALVQRGIQWGIITNKPMRFTDVLLPKLGFTVSPAVIVSGDTCDEPKPSVKPMFYACEQMGVEAQRCFYVGDAERDMQAGKNAGMTTVLADWGYISTEDQTENWFADFRIATPLDLLAILR